MHNYCTPHIIKENFENFLFHWCNYILLSQAYCVLQVVKTLTIISNNSLFRLAFASFLSVNSNIVPPKKHTVEEKI
jgi:hypothetical protein